MGYKYFGRARDLPGVRALFSAQGYFNNFIVETEAVKRTRYELYKCVDLDYYGFRDEESDLIKYEQSEQIKGFFSY